MMVFSEWSPENLPPWFERVTPVESPQRVLFPEDLDAVLAGLKVSHDTLGRWHQRGWVSFGPDRRAPLEPHDVNEIRFVRDVARSGLSDAHVAELLEQLPRPNNFDPDEVAYSFSLGWVWAGPVPPPDPHHFVDEHLDDWLDHLAANEDQSRLVGLAQRIGDLVSALAERSEEPNS